MQQTSSMQAILHRALPVFPLLAHHCSIVHTISYHNRLCLRTTRPCFLLSKVKKSKISTIATASMTSGHSSYTDDGDVTLLSFLSDKSNGSDDSMVILLANIQSACAKIATLLASGTTVRAASAPKSSSSSFSSGDGRDAPKPLDVVSNDIIKAALSHSNKVAAIASEEDESPVWFSNEGPYVVVFDPLDGSSNIDASIPTGSIFGIYRRLEEADNLPEQEKAELNVLQRGERLVAAVYALYSSATILCITLGSGTHAFTLDRSSGDFVLTNPNLTIPKRGQIYSVNDARYFDWPEGLRNYIDTVRQGKGQNPKKYIARYICSLVADFHRTILYGGLAMNPRSHLRLVYEANPLSFIAEQAGGMGSDGLRRILEIQPVKLHQRLPLFLGSPEDVLELTSYENIQQL